METSIQTFIEMCEWDPARFLVFSDNVFGTLIYYSHFLPLVLSLVVGFFVLIQNRKVLTNQLLFLITFLFSVWAFFDLILWATEKNEYTVFFWSVMILIEPFIYALSFYFVNVFVSKTDVSLKKKFAIFLPLLPIIILLPTKFVLQGFDLTNCYREAVEGFIAIYYVYFIEIVYTFWILDFAFRKYRQAEREMRKQIVLITIGVILFLISFVSGNIVGSLTEDWNLAQVGLFSMPIFVVFLAYMIVKFKTFNIKLIGTQMLIFALGFLVLGMIFIRTIQNVRIVAVATLLLIAVVGYLLIRGVKREVKQREELARLNLELEDLIKQRENLVHLVTHKVKGSFTRSKYIFAEMLDGTFGEISPEIKKRAEQGLESDNMGIETVDLVLSVANMQKGVVKYDMKEIDLKEIIFKTISEKKITVEAKGLKMETEIKPDTYHVSGDAFWLKEVINNLIENSLKYTKEGTITVGLEKTSGKVKFYVKDTGIGITEEDKKNLFTEGGRGKDSVKVNVDSTGYGLYSVKLIVDAHKGRVWAESEGMGKGSQFYVELDAT